MLQDSKANISQKTLEQEQQTEQIAATPFAGLSNLLNDPSVQPSRPHKNTDSYHLVSLMMYLLGIEERHFKEHKPPLIPFFEKYGKDRESRIIRNLCRLRTALERDFIRIRNGFMYDFKNLSSFPEYIPQDAVMELETDGVSLQKSKPDIVQYIIEINRHLTNRINNVKVFFPEWVEWNYIRPLFIMPNGLKADGVKESGQSFAQNKISYPFQCYMNLESLTHGNIFYNDFKFVSVLYELHGDAFEDRSLVRNASGNMIEDLYEFIERNEKILVVVDCENSDPIKLAASLSSLSIAQSQKIYKLILFDSAYTTAAWTTLCNTGITSTYNTEHIVIKRLVEHKSLVDMTLAVTTCKEVYANDVDSILLFSSDSDYWALIQVLNEVEFLVMLEKEKTGAAIIEVLESKEIHYCYIDDFCRGTAYNIKTKTILAEIQNKLNEKTFNITDILNVAISASWLSMTPKETEQFINRYIKNLKVSVGIDGTVQLLLPE